MLIVPFRDLHFSVSGALLTIQRQHLYVTLYRFGIGSLDRNIRAVNHAHFLTS